jgi:hypothetical protein
MSQEPIVHPDSESIDAYLTSLLVEVKNQTAAETNNNWLTTLPTKPETTQIQTVIDELYELVTTRPQITPYFNSQPLPTVENQQPLPSYFDNRRFSTAYSSHNALNTARPFVTSAYISNNTVSTSANQLNSTAYVSNQNLPTSGFANQYDTQGKVSTLVESSKTKKQVTFSGHTPTDFRKLLDSTDMYNVCLKLFEFLQGQTPWELCYQYIAEMQSRLAERPPLICHGAMLLWLLLATQEPDRTKQKKLLESRRWTQSTVDNHLRRHLNDDQPYITVLLKYEAQRMGMTIVCKEVSDWLTDHHTPLEKLWVLFYRLATRKDIAPENIQANVLLLWCYLATQEVDTQKSLLWGHEWTQGTVDEHLQLHMNEDKPYINSLLQYEAKRMGMTAVCTEVSDWLASRHSSHRVLDRLWKLSYGLATQKNIVPDTIQANVLLLWCYLSTADKHPPEKSSSARSWKGIPWTQEKVDRYLQQERDITDLVHYELSRRGIKLKFTSILDCYALNSFLVIMECEARLVATVTDVKLYKSLFDWFSLNPRKPPSEQTYWLEKSLLLESLPNLIDKNLKRSLQAEAVPPQIYDDVVSTLQAKIEAAQREQDSKVVSVHALRRPSEIWIEFYQNLKTGKNILIDPTKKRRRPCGSGREQKN